jgi:hypothetical protein
MELVWFKLTWKIWIKIKLQIMVIENITNQLF